MRPVSPRPVLPIDAVLPSILASLQQNRSLVVEAPPGAGKTTRVPAALLAALSGDILVLEPRRLAARLAARRVAAELGEQAGETVGYQVRFEEKKSARTRLLFVTEGILTRRLMTDPELAGVGAVILDEFHERHLESDLALALLKRLQIRRPELRLVVMSATLDAAPVAAYLGCPTVRSEGRLFPLSITHRPYSAESLHVQVRTAFAQVLREQEAGSVLVFLPGAAEIRRAMRECEPEARRAGVIVLPLYGELSAAEQDRAVTPSAERRLIVATNVAESSVTVEGVTVVIDSGLARVAAHAPWTGLPTLEVRRISKASAKQRAGRAGRTAPGRVLRLYTEEDYARRAEYDVPEIQRADLSQLALTLRAMRLADFLSLDWLDAPPAAAVASAEALLDRLRVNTENAAQLARYPLPPRLSRLIVDAVARGVGENGCRAGALLAAGWRGQEADLLTAIDSRAFRDDPVLRRHVEQLTRIARTGKSVADDDALLLSVLAAFPDRVARLRAGKQLLLANGVTVELAGETPPYEFMVALDAEDRSDKPLPIVRMTARIEPEWLIDLFPERMREQTETVWNRGKERAEAVSRLLYDELVVQESRDTIPADAASMLASEAMAAGLGLFVDEEALAEFKGRVAFAGMPDPPVEQVLRELCTGLRSFAELRSAAKHFFPLLEQAVDAERLRSLAPPSIRLNGGRQTKIHYGEGKPPWVASRLQDFFGMRDTPRIGPQRVPLVVHLLAPNQRAVQVTSDLEGFWERLYPEVRRALMRRYPRHSWPESP